MIRHKGTLAPIIVNEEAQGDLAPIIVNEKAQGDPCANYRPFFQAWQELLESKFEIAFKKYLRSVVCGCCVKSRI